MKLPAAKSEKRCDWSPPARVVWIEIFYTERNDFFVFKSPPARVVWIEISFPLASLFLC